MLLAPSTASDELSHLLPCDTRWCGWEGKIFAAAAVVRLAAVMSAFTIVILAETLLLQASAGGTYCRRNLDFEFECLARVLTTNSLSCAIVNTRSLLTPPKVKGTF